MSARRISLSDLADRQDVIDSPIEKVSQEPSEEATSHDAVASLIPAPPVEPVKAPTPLRPNRQKQVTPEPKGEAPRMRYDEYERKEARLRDDQYGRLTTASRRLNKTRKRQGERITENTLIRVAIDLLLNEEDKLAGTTELELRRSLGL